MNVEIVSVAAFSVFVLLLIPYHLYHPPDHSQQIKNSIIGEAHRKIRRAFHIVKKSRLFFGQFWAETEKRFFTPKRHVQKENECWSPQSETTNNRHPLFSLCTNLPFI